MTDAPPALGEVARTLLLAGKVMLGSGAGASRTEETMVRMGLACGLDSVNVFCTLTGFFITLVSGDEVMTRLLVVKRHGIDLGRIAAMNDLSRAMEQGEISLQQAHEQLREMILNPQGYSHAVRLLTRGLSCGAFAYLMGGTWQDALPAMGVGVLAQVAYDRVLRGGPAFVALYVAALVGTLSAVLICGATGCNLKFVTVGMLMPLVPGMALTSGIRDLIGGDLLAGTSRVVEAGLSAAAIAGGVYTVLVWFRYSLWI